MKTLESGTPRPHIPSAIQTPFKVRPVALFVSSSGCPARGQHGADGHGSHNRRRLDSHRARAGRFASRAEMEDALRYGSRSEVGGPAFSDMTIARQWFHERGFAECEICSWRAPGFLTHNTIMPGLQLHHILPRSAGGMDCLGNLCLVCSNCHRVAHILWPLKSRYKGKARQYFGPRCRTDFIIDFRHIMNDAEDFFLSHGHRRYPDWDAARAVHLIDRVSKNLK